jgi:transketolase
MVDQALIKKLEEKAKIIRRDAITMIKAGGLGWVGGSFSQADIIATLVFHTMKHDPKNPSLEDRDRLIVSKAHCCETVYAALGEAGYFSKEEYQHYGKYGAKLQAHTEKTTPGIEYSGGSLGQGLSFALGQAMAARIDAPKDSAGKPIPRYRVFCILGDGELDEGQVWEAVMAAAHYKVDNLYAFVDHNKYQSGGRVVDRINITPLAVKWRAFGWHTEEINGHNFEEILNAIDRAEKTPGRPHVIIAHTIKCKGVPTLENKNVHFCKLTDEMYEEAVKALK